MYRKLSSGNKCSFIYLFIYFIKYSLTWSYPVIENKGFEIINIMRCYHNIKDDTPAIHITKTIMKFFKLCKYSKDLQPKRGLEKER
jgi:hypothetical protein